MGGWLFVLICDVPLTPGPLTPAAQAGLMFSLEHDN